MDEWDLANATEKEEEAFELFERLYRHRHPTPTRPHAVDVHSVGLQFWMYLIVTCSAVLLASLRTADAFFEAASYSSTLAYVEAVTAIFAIEGGLVVYSTALAIRKQEISVIWLRFAIFLMIFISMVAGLRQSVGLIDRINEQLLGGLQYALALLLGAGTSLVAYVGGEVMGQQINIISNIYGERLKEYDERSNEYQLNMLNAWNRSAYRKIAREKLVVHTGSRTQRSVLIPTNRTSSNNRARKPPIKTMKIKKYLNETLDKEGRVAGVSELVGVVGCAKSTASEVRTRWLQEHTALTAHSEKKNGSKSEEELVA